MAITQKPTPLEASEEFQTFVNKGGRAAQEAPKARRKGKMVLRLPEALWEKVDALRAKRLAKVSRNQWILEAIEQRIEAEER
jgi:predicted HicB family RNase H-like nuclease